jgi:hypothetical protein
VVPETHFFFPLGREVRIKDYAWEDFFWTSHLTL